MSEKKKKSDGIKNEDNTQINELQQDDAANKIKALEEKLEEAEKEKAELIKQKDEEKDKFLRLCAEFDNFKKRTVKEKQAITADVTADVISSVLPVIDDLERAFNADNLDAEALKKGIDMVLKKAGECFKSLKIEEIDCAGKTFDPELQNAVMHIEDENFGEHIVVEVFQKGYKVGDKVIRHAMVKVAN